MAAKSTLTVESQRHQRALQTTARTFLNTMKSDDHSQEKYIDFLKDVKDLIQDHVSELRTCDVTEITKTVLKTVCDPLCKFLCPNESTTDSSDDNLPGHILNVEEDDIFLWVSTWYIDWWSGNKQYHPVLSTWNNHTLKPQQQYKVQRS